ncbi:MAG: immunoglobulin domain-containing protein [Chloroflexi bacterium]|nr:immunoglobulin domain-containing protein [Chloroflexota bacterium]
MNMPSLCHYHQGLSRCLCLRLASFLVTVWPATLLGAGPGALDPTFNAILGLSEVSLHEVAALAVQSDGKIVIGGEFTLTNGTAQSGLARLHPDGSLDPSFRVNLVDEAWPGWVSEMRLQNNGQLLVAGSFRQVNGLARTNVARLQPDGTLDLTFNPIVGFVVGFDVWAGPGRISRMVLQNDGKILIGGDFNRVNGFARTNLARLNADGTLDSGFAANLGPSTDPIVPVSALALQKDGKVLVAGHFFGNAPGTTTNLLRLNADGSLDAGFNPSFGGSVNSLLVQEDGKILVAGRFDAVNGVARTNLARLHANGVTDLSFDGGVGGGGGAFVPVSALAIQGDGKIFVAGEFRNIRGIALTNLARLNMDGSPDLAFRPALEFRFFFRIPSALASQEDGKLLVGGSFSREEWDPGDLVLRLEGDPVGPPRIDAPPADQIAYVGDTVSLMALVTSNPKPTFQWQFNGSGLEGATNATLTLHDLQFSHSGSYRVIVQNAAGTATSQAAILAVHPPLPGTIDPTYQPAIVTGGAAASEGVHFLARQNDGKMLIAGSFWSVNGVGRTNLARLNADGTLDLLFNPRFENVWGGSLGVGPLTVHGDGSILVAGDFDFVDGVPRGGLARLHVDGSLDLGFDPGTGVREAPFFEINSLAVQRDGKVLVGGFFDTFNGIARTNLARLNPDGSLDLDYNPVVADPFPTPETDVRVMVLQPDGKLVIAGSFSSVNGVGRTNIARLNPDGTLDAGFDPGSGVARFNFNFNAGVSALALQADGKLIIGGPFDTVHGEPRDHLARLNPDGSLDPFFEFGTIAAIFGAFPSDPITAVLAQENRKVIFAGSFTNVNFFSLTNLARLDAEGHMDGYFQADAVANSAVQALALQNDGKLVVAVRSTGVITGSGIRILRLNGDPFMAPFILTPPVSQTTGEGMNVSLSIQVTDNPLPIYQWQFNGTDIADATNAWLAIPNVRQPNAGQYRVKVSNALGSTNSRPVTLTVTPAPTGPGTVDIDFFPGLGVAGGGFAGVGSIAVQIDGKVLISGIFNTVDALERPALARLEATGALDLTFRAGLSAGDWVHTVVLQADGRMVIAGDFNSIGGVPRWGIARLNADGSVDSGFYPTVNTNGFVDAVAVQEDGKVLLGGSFTNVIGAARNGIARLQADGSLDTSFDPGTGVTFSEFIGLPAAVYRLVLQGNKVLMAGGFTQVNGVPRANLARLNADGSLDLAFVPPPLSGAFIDAMAVQSDGRIVLAYSIFDGGPRESLVRLMDNGSLDRTFGPPTAIDGPIFAIAPQKDGKLLIGGAFTHLNGVPRNGIARLNADGSLDEGFDPGLGVEGEVYALKEQADGLVLIGGAFTRVNGVPRHSIARLRGGEPPPMAPAITLQPSHWTVTVGADVFLTAAASGLPAPAFQWQWNGANLEGATQSMLILTNVQLSQAGNYSVVASNPVGVARSDAALLTVLPPPPGALDTGFAPKLVGDGFNPCNGFNPSVGAVLIQGDGKMIVSGDFTNVNGALRNGLARLNPDGSLDAGFDAGSGAWPGPFSWLPIYALAEQPDGKLLVGGTFTNFNGVVLNGIARMNADGSLDTTFNVGAGVTWSKAEPFLPLLAPGVYGLSVQEDGKILVAGTMTEFNGVARNGIARLNANGSLDGGFDPGLGAFPPSVSAVARSGDGKILIGGSFTNFNGVARSGVARLKANGSLDASFDPGTGAWPADVIALALQQDGKVLVGGSFTNFNGAARYGVARLNADGSLDLSFDPGSGMEEPLLPWELPVVLTLALQNDGRVLVGGFFTNFNGVARNHVARLREDGSVDTLFEGGQGANAPVVSLALQSDGKAIVAGFFTEFNGAPRSGLARIFGGDEAPAPRLSNSRRNVEGVFEFAMPTVAGTSYFLEFKDDLLEPAWHPWFTVDGDGTAKAFAEEMAARPQRFYRARLAQKNWAPFSVSKMKFTYQVKSASRRQAVGSAFAVTYRDAIFTLPERGIYPAEIGTYIYTKTGPNTATAFSTSTNAPADGLRRTIYAVFDSPESGRFAYLATGGGLPDESGSGTFQMSSTNVFTGGYLIGSLPSCETWTFRIAGLVLDSSRLSVQTIRNDFGLVRTEILTGVNYTKVRNYEYNLFGQAIRETGTLSVGAMSCDYSATIEWNGFGDIIVVNLTGSGSLLSPPTQSIAFVQRFGQFGQCIPY